MLWLQLHSNRGTQEMASFIPWGNQFYTIIRTQLLDVSTSAYYDWLANKDERDERQEKYTEAIKRIFDKSGKTYGVDRICGCLRREGYTASYKRVKKMKDALGLV